MMTYGDDPEPPLIVNKSALPVMDNFLFKGIKGTGIVTPGSISGSPGKGAPGIFITNVKVEDVDLGTTANPWHRQSPDGTANNWSAP
jgi:hypothetical protein